MIDRSALERLCTLSGVATEYADFRGRSHRVAGETLQWLLAAMGIPVGCDEDVRRAIEDHERAQWGRLLPPVQVFSESDSALAVPVTVPARRASQRLDWTLTEEGGRRRGGSLRPAELEALAQADIGGESHLRCMLRLGEMPAPGYHGLEVRDAAQPAVSAAMSVIVAPVECYQPEAVRGGGRVWGPAVHLFAVRSQRNWGMGDFSDLTRLLEYAAGIGAGIVGVSPLHALDLQDTADANPHRPVSRRFLNILYLDVESVADFKECAAAQELAHSAQFQARLRALRALELVDYDEVAAIKLQVLDLLYRHFREHHRSAESDRGRAYRGFLAEQGEALHSHCLYAALREHFRREDPTQSGWASWPEPYRDPRSQEVATFAAHHEERIDFFAYLQWQARLQLGAAGRRSFELGLGVGIYPNLAAGVRPGGAEVWSDQGLYAHGARLGAPPDESNPRGEDWGLVPPLPGQLRERAYAPFIAALRHIMRDAGALHIEHAATLMRQFWVPAGGTPGQGSYVSYPFRDLLGILVLESRRNRCLVVAEEQDLAPSQLREALGPSGVLSYRALYSERDERGGFKAPRDYPEQALAAVGPHDRPTLAGYWQGVDVDRCSELDLFTSPEVREQYIVARAQDRARLLIALDQEGLLPPGTTVHPVSAPTMVPALARAVHVFLARSPAKVVVVRPEDVFGSLEQIDVPGANREYPNWRRKLTLDIEEWSGDANALAFAEMLYRERGGSVKPPALPVPERPLGVALAIPRATYRLQFHSGFTFSQAAEVVPYLRELGISHCYASPFLKARPGSTHGYDIIDHNALNPELGSAEDFERYVKALRDGDMGQILDMVPNHMGIMGSDNAWWLDVLENGPASSYAQFFDIDWSPLKDELRGKVLLPVLGDHYGSILDRGELKLVFDAQRGDFSVYYYEHRFPIDPREYPRILGHHLERLGARLGEDNARVRELESLITAFGHLPARRETSPEKSAERIRDKEIHKGHLARLYGADPDIAWFVEENIREFNGEAVQPADFDLLHQLLEAQAYRLAYWRVASDEINYRRFFDINDLAALRMDNAETFDATHQLVLDLVAQGKVHGLRIDHPDGLYDPVRYFQRLQERVAALRALAAASSAVGSQSTAVVDEDKPLYVVAEKILASYEHLPEEWLVHGTTGYEFANLTNGLFVAGAAADNMERTYRGFVRKVPEFDELVYECKKLIMKVALASELNVLANQLSRIAEADRHTCDFTLNSLRQTLAEIVACFPVYRSYVNAGRVSAEDIRYVEWAVAVAKKRSQAADTSIFDFVRDVLLMRVAEGKLAAYRDLVTSFAMKFQQYTSPVMAKGLEDTAFYVYNRLVSLNDVGGEPRHFGVSVAAFHRANQERARRWPHAMLGSSTHDSKRSEDVRARINVLSEIPDEWRTRLLRWRRLNRSKKRLVDRRWAPSLNDEYLLYQTLIGVWPAAPLEPSGLGVLRDRVEQYMLKAVREAKVESSWINPNTEYEEAVSQFVRSLFAGPEKNLFLADFLPFQQRVSHIGMYNSLSQTLAKLTAPGVPDVYQGNELWDYSLVDPDNRRAVDYGRRQRLLRELKDLVSGSAEELAGRVSRLQEDREDGRIKLYVIWRALSVRGEDPALFGHGEYMPLAAEGDCAEHLCAYGRHYQGRAAVVVFPRLLAGLADDVKGSPNWHDTRVEAVPGVAARYRNVFTGELLTAETQGGRSWLSVARLLHSFPVALAVTEELPSGEVGSREEESGAGHPGR